MEPWGASAAAGGDILPLKHDKEVFNSSNN